jgi:hypothetical protein
MSMIVECQRRAHLHRSLSAHCSSQFTNRTSTDTPRFDTPRSNDPPPLFGTCRYSSRDAFFVCASVCVCVLDVQSSSGRYCRLLVLRRTRTTAVDGETMAHVALDRFRACVCGMGPLSHNARALLYFVATITQRECFHLLPLLSTTTTTTTTTCFE